MNTLLYRDGDESSEQLAESSDREITLGPTVILGIFFALAALCAVSFGFGYSMGRKATVTMATVSPNGTPSSTNFSGLKPPAGNAGGAGEAKTSALPPTAVPYTPPSTGNAVRVAEKATTPVEESSGTPIAEPKPAVRTEPATMPNPATTANGPAGGAMMVQIAAVSHQEDADLLMTTLKRRGYAVALHSEPQDKLLHVQIGPFPTHKEADAMRQRLLADGFNAIVKEPAK